MTDIQILDVIDHRSMHFTQRMLVLDRMPDFVFERKGSNLIGHDSGFFRFYGYEASSPGWEAFAGAKFEIPMADGSVIEAHGQWWGMFPASFQGLVYDHAVNTIEGLSRIHVFDGAIHVECELVDSWLAENEPSNNYHKYDPKHPDFGKHKIVSRWEEVSSCP